MAFDYLKVKPHIRATSAWANAVVDALNQLNDAYNSVVQQLSLLQPIYERISAGCCYLASHVFAQIQPGGSADLLLSNPRGTKVVCHVALLEVVPTGIASVSAYTNVTVTAVGTQVPALNLNLSSTLTPVLIVEYGGTYTAGDPVLRTVAPAGAPYRVVGSLADVGENLVMPEDTRILVRTSNTSQYAIDAAVRVLWWEEAT